MVNDEMNGRDNENDGDPSESDLNSLWKFEVERRIDIYERGEMPAIPLQEVLRKYSETLINLGAPCVKS